MKSQAFNITSWIALGAGVLSYLAGLWNLEAENAIKGYYFTVFAFIFNLVSMNSRNALCQETRCLRKLKE